MNSLEVDFSKPTCRICLKNKQEEEISSIFDMDAELYDLRIHEKIELCAGIKLLCDNTFPAFICFHCNRCLQISYKFRTTCQSSEEYLKTWLKIEPIEPKFENLVDHSHSPILENASDDSNETDIILSPLHQPFNEDNSLPCSPVNHEESFDEFISDNCDDDIWVDIAYSDGEESFSCSENIESTEQVVDIIIEEENDEIKEEEIPLEPKKKSNARKKKSKKSTVKKNLDVDIDGSAIIKKPRGIRIRNTQPHVCEICGNVYNRRHILEHHIKRHSDKKEFDCEICGRAFHSNFELKRHMRKHTGLRPYKCSYCPSAFGDHSTLTKHERVHRNERPFKCDICGSSFSYPGVLKRHKLVHTGEKPYKCEICGKCFNDRYHLASHYKTIQHRSDPRVEMFIKNIKENNF